MGSREFPWPNMGIVTSNKSRGINTRFWLADPKFPALWLVTDQCSLAYYYGFQEFFFFYLFYDRVKRIELCICPTQMFYIIINTCSTRHVMGIWRSCQTRPKCKILPSIINSSSFLTRVSRFVSSRTICLKSTTRKRLKMNYPRCMWIFVLVSFTTCWASLQLYEALELLQDRCLYFDTNSVEFTSHTGQHNPPLGQFLGQFKDELDGNNSLKNLFRTARNKATKHIKNRN